MSSIQVQIESALRSVFENSPIIVLNESHKHAVPKGSESHFLIEIVSDKFTGLSLLKRHRLVQDCLRELIPMVKALSLHTFTSTERSKLENSQIQSPNCKGAH
jgi:BolA family transcriptional regulator, general stress-responsive regulator